jgi:hypothetical protein
VHADVDAGHPDRLARGREPTDVGSSQSVISEVSSPIPYRRINARQPAWRRASCLSSLSSGAIRASIASTIASAISIRSRASAAKRSRSRNARPSAVRSFSGCAADAVVKQRGLDALHPLRAFAEQRVAHPRAGAPLADVLGRDPGLRQPAVGEQLGAATGRLAIGLGAAFAAPRARVSTGSAR